MPTPELLRALPTIERTLELARALAVLDAVMEDDFDMRTYAFDAAWDETEQMAKMRNGSGDEWYAWFGPPGAAIIGLDHESAMSPRGSGSDAPWPGLLDGVPAAFSAGVVDEPAFDIRDSSFVLWREPADAEWRAGPVQPPADVPDPDGAIWALDHLLDDRPGAFAEYAAVYHEKEPDPEAVAAIYRGDPLDAALVTALNPERDVAAALAEAADMGYPTA